MSTDDDPEKIVLSNGRELSISKEFNNEDDKVVTERLYNIWGSSSGAGSDFFNIYRKERNFETKRLEDMDRQWSEAMERKFFQTKRLIRMKIEDEKRLKRKIRRDKRKQRKKNVKDRIIPHGIKQGTIFSDDESDNEDEEHIQEVHDNDKCDIDVTETKTATKECEVDIHIEPVVKLRDLSKNIVICDRSTVDL